MEHKLANTQIAIDILSTLVLRDHSKCGAKGDGDNAHPSFRSKSNKKIKTTKSNERKFLSHQEIIDRMTEQIESEISKVCKESKLWVHPNLRHPSLSLMFLLKFTSFCMAFIWA